MHQNKIYVVGGRVGTRKTKARWADPHRYPSISRRRTATLERVDKKLKRETGHEPLGNIMQSRAHNSWKRAQTHAHKLLKVTKSKMAIF